MYYFSVNDDFVDLREDYTSNDEYVRSGLSMYLLQYATSEMITLFIVGTELIAVVTKVNLPM